jgi:pimeloyl-ACP methyl ester carboxylesterase
MDAVPTADVNGTTIWYDVVGTGPFGLVLHGGLGIDHTLYQATLGPLEQRLRLVYVDHRGNGRSGLRSTRSRSSSWPTMPPRSPASSATIGSS